TVADSQLGHEWSDEWSKDETNHWHVCTNEGCGEKNDEAAHTWTRKDDTFVTAPDCTTDGTAVYMCTCGAEKTQTVADSQLGHEWSDEWSKDEINHWHVCTHEGCGEKNDEAAHTWNEGVVTKEPTYDDEGERTFTCTICGHTRTESIPALPQPSNPDSTIIYYTLTINYVDGEGNAVADTYTRDLREGRSYSVTSPAVEGMTPDQETVSGTLNRSLTVTVVYTAVPEENVDETEPPLTETPETAEPTESAETEAPEEAEDLGDNDTPLSETPDVETTESAETEELDENDTPLADVPQTGDALWVWMVLALLSAAGLAWVGLKGKKGKRA
ncbi:MAG: MucBP domain-containing protein, partial [Oscillospiraceae bacterium]|nr:MucBP domain-containing protein [Oscillospiraceae bacterium]